MFATFFKRLPIAITLSLAAPAQAMDSNLYLIALAGQSNMIGAGDVRMLPVGFPMNGPRIWNFTNADIWELAREPIDSNYGQVDAVSRDEHPGVGPALAMADAFTAKYPKVSVGLIPCGKSGSSIEKWHPDMSARASIGKSRPHSKGKLRALVFWQDGQDGKDKKTAKQWGKNFKTMVTAWRADVGDPKLPVILLVLKPGTEQTLQKYPYRDVVRQQQLSVQLPYLTKIGIIGYDYSSDDIHLTTAGQLALGPVIAAALPAP